MNAKVSLAVAALYAIAACAGPGAAPADLCGPVKHPPLQGGGHLVGGQEPPVPYSSIPPTSGWHVSAPDDIATRPADRPLSEPQQVGVLEAGGVVISHHDLPAAQLTALERLVRSRFPGRAAVTSYDKLAPGEVAMTAWGVLQRCRGLDLARVEDFVHDHADGRAGPLRGH
ncbi:MAG TPA: DUF3105 domain-containing protein [Egibacteraceae bacterium]|nr:DUF3105 domain-containing protein [Egibacteraceae bacterium]